MNQCKKNRIVSILTVFGVTAFVAGCSSANDEPEASENASGTGGASTTGGNSATGGSSGSDGSGGAGNGTGGTSPWAGESAGGGIGQPCTADITEVAPSDGVIATFNGDDGFASGLAAFPPDGPSAVTFSTEEGALHITQDAPATEETQWPNVLLTFGAVETVTCIDASAFSGVEFSISGSLSGCTMQYATGDAAHQDRSSGAPIATGLVGSYQPQATITAAQLGSEPQTLTMPFVGDGAPTDGRPATPVDPTQLIFLFWQFTINPTAGAETPPCVADITIDDVKFY